MGAIRKSATINLRVEEGARDVIARAAEVSGKSLTAFMTDAAHSAAEQELLSQRFLRLRASTSITVSGPPGDWSARSSCPCRTLSQHSRR